MTKGILLLLSGLLGLMGFPIGCTTSPGSDLLVTQGSEDKMVTTTTQLDELVENASHYKGRLLKLAGAIVGIDETDEGYLVLAKWLPYPKTQPEEGPIANEPKGRNKHFLIRFVGKREREFHTIRGNKFLLEGTVEGTKQTPADLFGPTKDLLFVNTKCVHFWETGEANVIVGQGDSEYPPTRQRTLCAD